MTRHPSKKPAVHVSGLLGCALTFIFASTALAGLPPDITTLISRLRADTVGSTSTASASSHLSNQQQSGCWSDVDYASKARAVWPPSTHLNRVLSLAVAYHTVGHTGHKDVAMLAGVNKGIDCWSAKNPKSNNWWWNVIGKQLRLGPIGIVMDAELDAARRASIVKQLPTIPSRTGQNKVWTSQGVVHRGCLEKSKTRINTGLNGIKATIVVTTKEGIQPDWSFHQHGPQLYNAGYGMAFIKDTSYWANRTSGTSFAFAATKVDTLSSLLLDGDLWMVRGKMFDYSADGRGLSIKGQSSKGLVAPCAYLAQINTARAKEFNALKDHIEGKAGPPLSGNRHFWRSDFMAHQRPSLYASVKMCSTRTVGTETVNDENLLGYWLPFGLTYIARRGDEYTDIFPVWNWTLLPGVTAPAFAKRPNTQTQSTSFVGGASNGKIGVAAMQLNKANTQAHKAWFFFEDELVALGAGITSTHAKPVRTALNQCRLKGAVTVDATPMARGEHALKSAHWVHHDGVGYVLPAKGPLNLENDARSGSWKLINLNGSSTSVTLDLFTLWLDHGTSPTGASYHYIVVPKKNPAALATYAASPPVRTLVNTSAHQGVRHDLLKVSGLVFAQPGIVSLSAALKVGVKQPCIVIVDESKPAPLVTVADPTGKLPAVEIVIRRPGQPDEILSFALPSGGHAGKSMTLPGKTTLSHDQGIPPGDGAGTRDGPASLADSGATEAGGGADAGSSPSGGGGCRLGTANPEGGMGLLVLLLLLWRRQRR